MLSIRLVITRGRDANRQECAGYHSLALTPYLCESTRRVGWSNTLVDLIAVPRFGVRRATGFAYRIAGVDRPGAERSVVVELQWRTKIPLYRNFPVELKVELVN